MRNVSMQDLQSFNNIVGEVAAKSAGNAKLAIAAEATMRYNTESGDLDAALEFGMSSGIALVDEHEKLMRKFEQAAFNFLGEKRLPAEGYGEYFFRIATMSEADLLGTMKRNGIALTA